MSAIPEKWIKEYVDQLITAAQSFGNSAMGEAAANKANTIMDMVAAYRQSQAPPCPHGNRPHECEACFRESDYQYDAMRERDRF